MSTEVPFRLKDIEGYPALNKDMPQTCLDCTFRKGCDRYSLGTHTECFDKMTKDDQNA